MLMMRKKNNLQTIRMKKFLTMACALACATTSLTSCGDDDDDSFNWGSVIPSLTATIGTQSYDHRAFFYEASGENSVASAWLGNVLPTSGTAVVGTSTNPYLVVVFGGQDSGTYTENTKVNPMKVLNNGLTNGDWSTNVEVGALVIYRGAGENDTTSASNYISTTAEVNVTKASNLLGATYYDGTFTATLVSLAGDTISVSDGKFSKIYGKSQSSNISAE